MPSRKRFQNDGSAVTSTQRCSSGGDWPQSTSVESTTSGRSFCHLIETTVDTVSETSSSSSLLPLSSSWKSRLNYIGTVLVTVVGVLALCLALIGVMTSAVADAAAAAAAVAASASGDVPSTHVSDSGSAEAGPGPELASSSSASGNKEERRYSQEIEVRHNEYTRSSNVSQQRSKVKRAPGSYPDSVSDVTRNLIHKNNYNKQDPPLPDKTTLVQIGIYVISFYSISEQTMDYQVSMYLRQKWIDPRLQYKAIKGKICSVRLGNKEWENIWIPDTFLRNEKGAEFHSVTVENRMLKLSCDGSLWYVIKVSATLSCPMNLQNFPLDTQQCPMLFESFGYTMDVMSFGQLENPVQMSEELQLPQFKIVDTRTNDCSQNYTTGAYPCLEFTFVLRRDIGYFLIQVYVPSILVVILSWVSFWINVDASPARVSIGLLTVLTTTTMSGAARASLPRVSYIKAIDIWMIICLLFVFASLIEYAIVNTLARRVARPVKQPRSTVSAGGGPSGPSLCGPGSSGTGSRPFGGAPCGLPRRDVEMGSMPLQQLGRRKPQKSLSCFKTDRCAHGATNAGGRGLHETDLKAGPTPGGGAPGQGPSGPNAPAASAPPPAERDGKFQARRVDKISRKVFPVAFLLFNIVYWTIYTMSEPLNKGSSGQE